MLKTEIRIDFFPHSSGGNPSYIPAGSLFHISIYIGYKFLVVDAFVFFSFFQARNGLKVGDVTPEPDCIMGGVGPQTPAGAG